MFFALLNLYVQDCGFDGNYPLSKLLIRHKERWNEKRKCQFDTVDITMINNALTKSERNKISKYLS